MLMIFLLLPCQGFAAFVSGSTGADGAFAPSTDTVLQIPDNGVFNFTTVTIPAGVTVTFAKNAQNTPVTMLATGDVTINGTINVNGADASYIIPGIPGPGGFYGGAGALILKTGNRGEGPGGGNGGAPRPDASDAAGGGGGGSFGGAGSNGVTFREGYPAGGSAGSVYGNERILPLIGGAGGGGAGGSSSYIGGAGGGGGGAILIASNGTITIDGSITANGGAGASSENASYGSGGGGGSGGGIRLVAQTIAGNGTISSTGGSGGTTDFVGYPYYGAATSAGGAGGLGRIRLEAATLLRTAATSPPMSLGAPIAVLPANMPSLVVSSIGGVSTPSVPKGALSAPDIVLPYNIQNPVSIVVSAKNIPAGMTVTVKAAPSQGSAVSGSGVLSGTGDPLTVTIPLTISTAYPSLITASVTFELTAANGAPVYAQGELVQKVRVAANFGGGSSVTYITASGKEIPAVM
ncbi:MAG: hypothetical protein A2075_13335 [Geobacteraceae bacterium GWC2_58_44]|nr:MAG: hypothetical protein A2075_13335 [Geobacteraceae bacterium GWC2_58_44]HBG08218.1 hypothetical protein [Geobacter sp.]